MSDHTDQSNRRHEAMQDRARTLLTEPDAYALLEQHGIPVPPHGVARSPQDAAAIASRIGFPVVMKVISPQVVHKSDAGGVVTGIAGPEMARMAFTRITETVPRFVPGAHIDGVLVAKQMEPGVEVLVGGTTDPAFGKVLTFGMGGILVELLRDVSLRVLPVSPEEIRQMVHEIRGHALIRGFRREKPRDEEQLVKTIHAVATLFLQDDTLAEFDLNPLILYEQGCCAVDARIYRGERREQARRVIRCAVPEELFTPSSIAVVGASADPKKVGHAVLRNLLPFPGQLYPVNPNRKEILGRTAYPSLTAIPGPVDLAVIAVPAHLVTGIVDEAGRKGVKVAAILSSGFREAGADGRAEEDRLVEIARSHDLRILGPNCLGIMLPHRQVNTTFEPVTPLPGQIAFLSQSGAVIATIVDWSRPEAIGFSAVISVGNQADLGFEDFLIRLSRDSETRAIILYIEEIRDGRGFMDVVRHVSARVPVIALKSGSSVRGKQAAVSHTGSLAGAYEVYMAAFRQAGVLAASSLRESFLLAELLASEGYPKGNRAVVISNAGGFAVLASDYAERYGVELVDLDAAMLQELDAFLPPAWSHANPMDLIGDSGADVFARVFDLMIRRQDTWDVAFVISVPDAVLDMEVLGRELVRFSKSTRKMIVGCLLGGDTVKESIRILRDQRIPNFPDPEEAFRVVGKACSATRVKPHTDRDRTESTT
ncbi:MAG: acetate--CoA ligase family protein [Methanomicrobiales archaeon]|nr:acetate--CoA ligase family protein [Methanomicrobiales archaeon]